MRRYSPDVAYLSPISVAIETAPVFVAGKRFEIAELFVVVVCAAFADASAFTLTVKSDTTRYSTPSNLAATDSDTQLPLANVGSYRKEIMASVQEGMTGRWFQSRIDKVLGSNGEFEYYGIEYKIIPRPELTGEFYAAATSVAIGW